MSAKIRVVAVLIVLCLAAFGAAGAWAQAAAGEAAPVVAEKTPPAAAVTPIVDQRALDMLKRMSDTLKKAKTVSFQARSLVPIKAPNGMWVSLFSDSRVVMQEPDKLFVEKRGDVVPLDFYFNGTTVSAYSPTRNVFAEKSVTGTIDALIEKIDAEGENAFPYADILISDPYTQLTANMVDAIYVGQSTLRGVKTDHLAFTNKAVEWQIWIGAEDYLPRMVSATYSHGSGDPTYTVEFFEWDIMTQAPAEKFMYKNTTQAAKVEYRAPTVFRPQQQ